MYVEISAIVKWWDISIVVYLLPYDKEVWNFKITLFQTRSLLIFTQFSKKSKEVTTTSRRATENHQLYLLRYSAHLFMQNWMTVEMHLTILFQKDFITKEIMIESRIMIPIKGQRSKQRVQSSKRQERKFIFQKIWKRNTVLVF